MIATPFERAELVRVQSIEWASACGEWVREEQERQQPAEASVIVPAPTSPKEAVNHPPHYNVHPSGVECIDIIEHFSFNIGNAVKYLWRADEKGKAVEDLRKAAWYVAREIELLTGEPMPRDGAWRAEPLRDAVPSSMLEKEIETLKEQLRHRRMEHAGERDLMWSDITKIRQALGFTAPTTFVTHIIMQQEILPAIARLRDIEAKFLPRVEQAEQSLAAMQALQKELQEATDLLAAHGLHRG